MSFDFRLNEYFATLDIPHEEFVKSIPLIKRAKKLYGKTHEEEFWHNLQTTIYMNALSDVFQYKKYPELLKWVS